MPAKPRIHIPAPIRPGTELVLDADRSHYVSRVLRLRAANDLVLFDGNGDEYPARISHISRQGVTVSVGRRLERDVESPLEIHLAQGISRGDRMDFVVQKATELGAHRITPVITGFSVVRLDAEKAAKRALHWTKIARSACEQCGRNVVPSIDPPQALPEWLHSAKARESTRLVLHPAADKALASMDDPGERIALLIGPEGGLSDAEYEQAREAGFVACSLGPRILRTETAAVAALAALQARWGDLR